MPAPLCISHNGGGRGGGSYTGANRGCRMAGRAVRRPSWDTCSVCPSPPCPEDCGARPEELTSSDSVSAASAATVAMRMLTDSGDRRGSASNVDASTPLGNSSTASPPWGNKHIKQKSTRSSGKGLLWEQREGKGGYPTSDASMHACNVMHYTQYVPHLCELHGLGSRRAQPQRADGQQEWPHDSGPRV